MSIERLLTDQRYPPVRRLVHSLTLCRLLQQARTRNFSDQRLGELFDVLEQNVAGEVGDLFTNRQPPSSAGSILFRQTAAEFVRLHPQFTRPAELARAVSLDRRRLENRPRTRPAAAAASYAARSQFADLEAPLGLMTPDIYQPLNRLIETSAASWSYALANRSGWSIVESVRMLALLLPIGLWMLRWIAAGRQATPDDIPEIISALDRGQGFAPLAGTRQRWRLSFLTQLGDLERLVIWYIQ